MWFTDYNGHGIGKVALQIAPVVTTGGPSAINVFGATVNPAGGAVGAVSFQYGRTPSHGSTVAATPAALPAGGSPVPVSARLTSLPTKTTIHYRVVATNAYGTSYGADHTLQTDSSSGCPSGAPCPHAFPKPSLGHVRQSHRRWREHGRSRRHAPAVGTTFSFALNAAATIHLDFTRPEPDRRVKARCVALTARDGHDRACTRTISVGSLTAAGHQGTNRFAFRGRVSRHRLLAPGRYTVEIRAINPSGASRHRS